MHAYFMIVLAALCLAISSSAQDTMYAKKSELAAKSTELSKSITQLRRSSSELNRAVKRQQRKMAQMEAAITEERLRTERTADSLKTVVGMSEKTVVQTQGDVTALRSAVNQHVIMWVVAILGLLLFGVVLGGLLQRRMTIAVGSMDKRLDATKLELETKTIKLDQKVVELLGTQLLLLKDERTVPGRAVVLGDIRTVAAEQGSPHSDQFVQCKGMTKNGSQCTRKAVPGTLYCTQHAQ